MTERFINIPNLPGGNVSLVMVDGRINRDIQNELEELKIKILKTEALEGVESSIAYHPDIMLYHAGENKIIVCPNIPRNLLLSLKKEGFNIVTGISYVHSPYPYDVCYNAARVGNYLLCCEKYTDYEILRDAHEKNLKIININQGYSKCSICVTGDNAIITSDEGIAKKVKGTGIDCLKINQGSIDLYEMSFGFIGGATGFISKDELAFCGDAGLHPDFETIKSFLYKHGKKHINLSTNKMMDMGTLIPLKEYSIM